MLQRHSAKYLSAFAALALGGALLAPSAAYAAPTPLSGPTSGGTTVSDTESLGVRFTSLAAGYNGAAAIGDDGGVYSFPLVSQVYPVPAPSGVTFTQVSGGASELAALGSDGNAYIWAPATASAPTPTVVSAPAGVTFTQVFDGSFALGDNGRMYTFGLFTTTPTAVQTPAGVSYTQIAGSLGHTVAIGNDGNTYAWGGNNNGQLGDGTTGSTTIPVLVQAPAGVRFTQVAVADSASFALGDDGRTYAWGANSSGQLGNGTNTDSSLPVEVVLPAGVTFTSIEGGHDAVAEEDFALALGDNGKVYSWGWNALGELGNGTNVNSSLPGEVTLPAGVTFTQIAAGDRFGVAIGDDGQSYAWGYIQTSENIFTYVPVSFTDVTITDVKFGEAPGENLTQSTTVPGEISWTVQTPRHCGATPVTVTWKQFGDSTTTDSRGDFAFGSAPTVSIAATDDEVEAGGTLTIVATVTGDDAPRLFWTQRPWDTDEWEYLADVTGDTLTVENVQMHTEYRVTAVNCWGYSEDAVSNVVRFPPDGGGETPPPGGGETPPPGPGATGPGEPGAQGPSAGGGNNAQVGAPATGKGAGNALWLPETGSGLLWTGAAAAAGAVVLGTILMIARKRRLSSAS